MATAKKSRSAVMALAFVLGISLMSGCSTVKKTENGSNATAVASTPYQAPHYAMQAQPAPQVVAQPVTTTVIGEFPTSMNKPTGKAWAVMSKDGSIDGYAIACKSLGLTAEQCVTYNSMHTAGACVTMEVVNGVVLDRLTFTKDGKPSVQKNVLVALKNPLTRKAEVCNLGGGTIAIRFHGCGNHALVTGWKQPLTTTVTTMAQVQAPRVARAQCTGSQIMRLNVWSSEALNVTGVRDMIEGTRSSSGYYVPNRVSRAFGATFRAENAAGRLARSSVPHSVTVTHVHGVQETLLYNGFVTGSRDVAMPVDLQDSDVVKVYFPDYGKLTSPLKGDLRGKGYEFGKGKCNSVTNFHAIEAGK